MLLSSPVVALLLPELRLLERLDEDARRADVDRPDLFAPPLRLLAVDLRALLALDLRELERLALDLRALERVLPDFREVDRLPPDLLDELFLAAISLALLLEG
jgi:hypothetical protein